MAHPLFSSRIKINRAKKHFADLHAEVEAFSSRNPYQVIVDTNSEPAIQIHRIRIREPIPDTLSPIIGDLLHNLMGALDSLATSLVIANGVTTEEHLRHTYFPIDRGKDEFSNYARIRGFFQNAGPDAEKLIRRIEPYKRGKGHTLFALRELNNRDKHRAIIPVITSVGQIVFSGLMPFSEPPPPPKFAYNLKEGDEILRTAFFEPHFEAKTDFVFHIGIDEHKPIIDRVKELINAVESVIHLFN